MEKRSLGGHLIALYNPLKGGFSQVISLFSQVMCNRIRGASSCTNVRFQLWDIRRISEKNSSLDNRINFFPESVVRHWCRMTRKVVEPPLQGAFTKCVDMALGDMV